MDSNQTNQARTQISILHAIKEIVTNSVQRIQKD